MAAYGYYFAFLIHFCSFEQTMFMGAAFRRYFKVVTEFDFRRAFSSQQFPPD